MLRFRNQSISQTRQQGRPTCQRLGVGPCVSEVLMEWTRRAGVLLPLNTQCQLTIFRFVYIYIFDCSECLSSTGRRSGQSDVRERTFTFDLAGLWGSLDLLRERHRAVLRPQACGVCSGCAQRAAAAAAQSPSLSTGCGRASETEKGRH